MFFLAANCRPGNRHGQQLLDLYFVIMTALGLWVIVCFLLTESVQAAKTACRVPSVSREGATNLTCYFPENVGQSKKDFTVYRYSGKEKPDAVVDCLWVAGNLDCHVRNGYEYDKVVSDHTIIQIPRVFENVTGTYSCQLMGSQTEDLQFCELLLAPGTCELHSENRTLTCNFPEDVTRSQKNFAVYRFDDLSIQVVINCLWHVGKFACDESPGYKGEQISNRFVVQIPQTSEDQTEGYLCEMSGAVSNYVSLCKSHLQGLGFGPGVKVDHVFDNSDSASFIAAVVVLVLLLAIALAAIFLICKYPSVFNKTTCRRLSEKKSATGRSARANARKEVAKDEEEGQSCLSPQPQNVAVSPQSEQRNKQSQGKEETDNMGNREERQYQRLFRNILSTFWRHQVSDEESVPLEGRGISDEEWHKKRKFRSFGVQNVHDTAEAQVQAKIEDPPRPPSYARIQEEVVVNEDACEGTIKPEDSETNRKSGFFSGWLRKKPKEEQDQKTSAKQRVKAEDTRRHSKPVEKPSSGRKQVVDEIEVYQEEPKRMHTIIGDEASDRSSKVNPVSKTNISPQEAASVTFRAGKTPSDIAVGRTTGSQSRDSGLEKTLTEGSSDRRTSEAKRLEKQSLKEKDKEKKKSSIFRRSSSKKKKDPTPTQNDPARVGSDAEQQPLPVRDNAEKKKEKEKKKHATGLKKSSSKKQKDPTPTQNDPARVGSDAEQQPMPVNDNAEKKEEKEKEKEKYETVLKKSQSR